MYSGNTNAFSNLYPDVDPTQGLPLTRAERLSIVIAGAVLSFGFLISDIIVAGAGLGLLLFSTIYPSQKTGRRIRKEARDRFPQEDWFEYRALRRNNLSLLISLFWVAIIAINVATFWFALERFGMPAAYGAATLTGVLLWLMPGMNPMWAHKKSRETTVVVTPRPVPPATPQPQPRLQPAPTPQTTQPSNIEATAQPQPTSVDKRDDAARADSNAPESTEELANAATSESDTDTTEQSRNDSPSTADTNTFPRQK